MSKMPDRTRVYLTAEPFFRIAGNHGIAFLKEYEAVLPYFTDLLLLTNRAYLQHQKLTPEEVMMYCNKEKFGALYNEYNHQRERGRPWTYEEAMDRWITLITAGFDAFYDQMELVIHRLHRNENIIRAPYLDIEVVDVDTGHDEDLILFITYDYLPF